MRRNRGCEDDRGVQGAEGRDALMRVRGRRVAKELEPLVEQDALQVRSLRSGQVGEAGRRGVDRSQGGEQEVARGAQPPVDRQGDDVEDAALRARENTRASASEIGTKKMRATYTTDRTCVCTPVPSKECSSAAGSLPPNRPRSKSANWRSKSSPGLSSGTMLLRLRYARYDT